jgi:hypothetical protein
MKKQTKETKRQKKLREIDQSVSTAEENKGIYLNNMNLVKQDFVYLVKQLESKAQFIETIDLSDNKLYTEGVEGVMNKLCRILLKHDKIKVINFSRSGLSSKSIGVILNSFSTEGSLEELYLNGYSYKDFSGNFFTPEALCSLKPEALRSFTLEKICYFINKSPFLKKLCFNIDNNDEKNYIINNEYVIDISNALYDRSKAQKKNEKMGKIEMLGISLPDVPIHIFKLFVQSISSLDGLKQLDLSNSSFLPHCFKELSGAFQNKNNPNSIILKDCSWPSTVLSKRHDLEIFIEECKSLTQLTITYLDNAEDLSGLICTSSLSSSSLKSLAFNNPTQYLCTSHNDNVPASEIFKILSLNENLEELDIRISENEKNVVANFIQSNKTIKSFTWNPEFHEDSCNNQSRLSFSQAIFKGSSIAYLNLNPRNDVYLRDYNKLLSQICSQNIPWSPNSFKSSNTPENFKRFIVFFLLCLKEAQKKLNFRFPKPIVTEIIKQIDRREFVQDYMSFHIQNTLGFYERLLTTNPKFGSTVDIPTRADLILFKESQTKTFDWKFVVSNQNKIERLNQLIQRFSLSTLCDSLEFIYRDNKKNIEPRNIMPQQKPILNPKKRANYSNEGQYSHSKKLCVDHENVEDKNNCDFVLSYDYLELEQVGTHGDFVYLFSEQNIKN